ncbi:MAG TPA: glycosyltransferase family 2 protein [Candidatus Omnitrophica bacterium]|nr:glycosyltransferase family 2 protein [Candidatus Omnitrophota bacterium]
MIYILLPAYNEERSLEFVIPKIDNVFKESGQDYLLIVCDDGSSDETAKILKQLEQNYPIEVLHHKINRGLGETSRDLFERAAEISKPGDVIVRLDCDDTHEPKFIPQMIAKINEGFDVVIASRFRSGGGQMGLNGYKTFLTYGASIFMAIFFPIKGVRDYSCGFRAYRAETIKQAIEFFGNRFIQLKGLGFTCTLEKLIKLKLLGAKFSEVPFVLHYNQKKSKSKMVSSITTLGYFTMVLLYHWPWGGWKAGYRDRIRKHLKRK